MRRDQVLGIYDDGYAASYDEKFLLSALTRPDTEHELELLRGLLRRRPGTTWLDVACGTGFYLSRFPEVTRAGCDLSPAMLGRARQCNPDIPLVELDFREPKPEWSNRWGLVSCMYYAYTLVETFTELEHVLANLADWTAPDGTCFVPIGDPRLIAGVNLPYHATTPFPGDVTVTGIVWSYVEDGGRKVHSHLLTPNREYMVEQFEQYFESVSIIEYPPPAPGWPGRPALVASRKRR